MTLSQRRQAAAIIDLFVYWAFVVLIGQLAPPLTGLSLWENPTLLELLLLPVLLMAGLELRFGRTPGKYLAGLRLSFAAGTRLRFLRLVWRQLLKLVSLTAGLLSPLALIAAWFGYFEGIAYGLLGLALVLLPNLGLWLKGPWQGRSLYDIASGSEVQIADAARRPRPWQSWGTIAAACLIGLVVPGPGRDDGCACGSDGPSVKTNMHIFQLMVETYAGHWNGDYPDSLARLEADAKAAPEPYWRELHNPYPRTGKGRLLFFEYRTQSVLGGPAQTLLEANQAPAPGRVKYKVSPDRHKYWIYGFNQNAQLLIDKGQPFTLTNS